MDDLQMICDKFWVRV